MGDASARALAVLPTPRRGRGPKMFYVFIFKHNAVLNTWTKINNQKPKPA